MIPDKIYCWNGVLGSFYASPQKQMDTICKELEAKLRGEYEIEEENEDERIRKLLVWQVYRNIEDETNDLAQSVYDGIKGHDPDLEESIEDWKKCLAWLEKQKGATIMCLASAFLVLVIFKLLKRSIRTISSQRIARPTHFTTNFSILFLIQWGIPI